MQRTGELLNALVRVGGVTSAFDAPRFHEAVVLLDRPAAPVLAALAKRGIAAGLDLAPSYPELGSAMLICATETKTHADIETYERALRAVLAMPHDVRGAA
jgi:glycine dehydrogenase subunit 1